jgi:hypothetical protein
VFRFLEMLRHYNILNIEKSIQYNLLFPTLYYFFALFAICYSFYFIHLWSVSIRLKVMIRAGDCVSFFAVSSRMVFKKFLQYMY